MAEPRTCLQPLEAFHLALDAVNSDASLLPGIRLGGVSLDSCDSEQHSLEQTMEMIQVGLFLVLGVI